MDYNPKNVQLGEATLFHSGPENLKSPGQKKTREIKESNISISENNC